MDRRDVSAQAVAAGGLDVFGRRYGLVMRVPCVSVSFCEYLTRKTRLEQEELTSGPMEKVDVRCAGPLGMWELD
jgi:hypothetical protein